MVLPVMRTFAVYSEDACYNPAIPNARGTIMEDFRQGVESNTGNYKSIIQFFVTNKEKDRNELKREFSKEYGPRPFNV